MVNDEVGIENGRFPSPPHILTIDFVKTQTIISIE